MDYYHRFCHVIKLNKKLTEDDEFDLIMPLSILLRYKLGYMLGHDEITIVNDRDTWEKLMQLDFCKKIIESGDWARGKLQEWNPVAYEAIVTQLSLNEDEQERLRLIMDNEMIKPFIVSSHWKEIGHWV